MAISTTRGRARTDTATPINRRRDDTRLALLFILPALIGFLIFMVWPTIRGIYLSFTKFNLLTPPEFNGLDNYIRMVQDPVFWNAMKVTLYYVILNIGFQTVLALVIAVMMQRLTQKTWLRGVCRSNHTIFPSQLHHSWPLISMSIVRLCMRRIAVPSVRIVQVRSSSCQVPS